MTLLCRIDDIHAAINFHALCRRALADISEDNQVAFLVLDNVYIVHAKKTYAEVASMIENESSGDNVSLLRNIDDEFFKAEHMIPDAYGDEAVSQYNRLYTWKQMQLLSKNYLHRTARFVKCKKQRKICPVQIRLGCMDASCSL